VPAQTCLTQNRGCIGLFIILYGHDSYRPLKTRLIITKQQTVQVTFRREMFGLNIFGSASPPTAAPDKASAETPVTNARVVDLKTLIFFGKLSLLFWSRGFGKFMWRIPLLRSCDQLRRLCQLVEFL
jgi:hypothetical protein